MKKLILSLALAGAMGFYVTPVMSQESVSDGGWTCDEVSPGTTVCDHEDGRSYGYHDSTDYGDGSCGGSPSGCRILF